MGDYSFCVSDVSCAMKFPTTQCDTGWFATDHTAADKVTCYSNSASFLDIFAPSNDASTLSIGGYSNSFGGTSAACPYAAGAAAALQSAAKAEEGQLSYTCRSPGLFKNVW